MSGGVGWWNYQLITFPPTHWPTEWPNKALYTKAPGSQSQQECKFYFLLHYNLINWDGSLLLLLFKQNWNPPVLALLGAVSLISPSQLTFTRADPTSSDPHRPPGPVTQPVTHPGARDSAARTQVPGGAAGLGTTGSFMERNSSDVDSPVKDS